MKKQVAKTVVTFLITFAAIIVATSCSSSKSNGTAEVAVVHKSQVQLYAEDTTATTLRAWASYNGFPRQNIEQFAAMKARAELSRMVSALATNSIAEFVNKKRGEELISKDTIAERITLVSSNLLIGSRVVKSERYRLADGTHTAYVCVEMDPAALAATLQKQEEIINLFLEYEEMSADFNSQDFNETMEKCFEEFRTKKGN